MKALLRSIIITAFLCPLFFCVALYASDIGCVNCHKKVTPGHVKDWELSKHFQEEISCSECHGESHNSEKDFNQVNFPDEGTCGQCHEQQYNQFLRGKHSMGWESMHALPVSAVEPELLIDGAQGCGGCHNMGIKKESDKKSRLEKGYKYNNNSCDECHTRHTFSKKEAQHPSSCMTCHMGFDHPQWEMWSSSKHGTRWAAKNSGSLPKDASAPTCQQCHLPGGTHENKTAWGFLGVRLPMPADKKWAEDRVTILKALGVLDPKTGQPTNRLEAVKNLDLARLDQKSWEAEREKMINVCSGCHSKQYARQQIEKGDKIMQKADDLMAKAINIVANLYKDGFLKKPANYSFAYPDLLYFMRTGAGDIDKLSYIEQVLLEMFLKHRMRTYQSFFHINPDYAYWYGWAMMTKDLGEIEDLDRSMRASK